MKNPFAVDRPYVVSFAALKEICAALSDERRRWAVTIDYMVEVTFTNPGEDGVPNDVSYRFPVVANLDLFGPEEGTMVCLYPPAAQAELSGLYLEDGKLCHDDMADWESFWFPLEAKLCTYSNRPAEILDGVLSQNGIHLAVAKPQKEKHS